MQVGMPLWEYLHSAVHFIGVYSRRQGHFVRWREGWKRQTASESRD